MPNIVRCNDCAVHRCTKWTTKKNKQGQWENIPLIEDSSHCTSFLESEPFKIPLLTYLIFDEKKNKDLAKVLEMYNFQIKETNKYPFFKLAIRRKK